MSADGLERIGVEGAEPLVEEDGLQFRGAAQAGQLVGEGQCESQAGLECFAAGQGAHRARGVGVEVVDDVELALLVAEVEAVVRQLAQPLGGAGDQGVEG